LVVEEKPVGTSYVVGRCWYLRKFEGQNGGYLGGDERLRWLEQLLSTVKVKVGLDTDGNAAERLRMVRKK